VQINYEKPFVLLVLVEINSFSNEEDKKAGLEKRA
jgi:hypothetical protein